MDLPFDGAISAYFENDAPAPINKAIKRADKDDILSDSYPHSERLGRKQYDREMDRLQIELVKLQAWARDTGTRIAMIFEGREWYFQRYIKHLPTAGDMVFFDRSWYNRASLNRFSAFAPRPSVKPSSIRLSRWKRCWWTTGCTCSNSGST